MNKWFESKIWRSNHKYADGNDQMGRVTAYKMGVELERDLINAIDQFYEPLLKNRNAIEGQYLLEERDNLIIRLREILK